MKQVFKKKLFEKFICLPLSLAQSSCHLLNQLKNDPHRDSVVRVFPRAFAMMSLCFHWLVKFSPSLMIGRYYLA